MNELRCEHLRGGRVESVHLVRAHVEIDGRAAASHGKAGDPVFMRSCAKPFQALAALETGGPDAYGFTPEELALMSGSHDGSAENVRVAASMLGKARLSAGALRCGVHAPSGPKALKELHAAGEAPVVLHNNCSGKHAGMLAAARFLGAPLAGYLKPSHPVQRRIRAALAQATGVADSRLLAGTDGCSAPTYAVPLKAIARAGAALATTPGSLRRIRDAMMAHPARVGHPCANLMQAAPGRLVAKAGAEGVYLAGFPEKKAGLALKVIDGHARAWLPVLAFLIRRHRLLEGDDLRRFERFAPAAITNHAGLTTGSVRVRA